MSFNGSGTFVINSTGQPVVANTVISATVFNALTADLASGLTNCITKDGQSTPTANIPMGSNKITGLANGTLIGDAANLGQVQSTVAKLISITGTDTVLGTMSPTLTAYAAGQLFYFVASGANTGAVTLNIDALGAKNITRDGSTALAAGDINSGEIVVVIYDGTRFQMINAANSFGNTTINGTLTVTGNTGLQANVSVASALSVGGTFAVTGAATLGSTLAVTGKSDLPTVSTASANAAVAVITDLSAAGASITSANVGTAVVTTGTVTNLTATSASVASVNAGVALLTTATVTDLTATGASIASANLGNAVISALTLTGVSVASANVGVANITDLRATGASVTSANVGTAVITTGTVTNLTATSASVASANAAVALVTTGTITNLTSTAASIASANVGTAVITGLTVTGASIASANAGNVQAAIASVGSANLGTAVITTGTLTNLTATSASVASVNAAVALVTTGTVTNLTSTAASIASANIGVAAIGTLSFTGASIASLNAGTATITTGNLTFSGTAQRITGDMSSATHANRLSFQSSVTNGATSPFFIPNGTGTSASVVVANASDPTNSSFGQFIANGSTDVRVTSGILGTGTYLPMTFYTGGSERVRIDTSGNVGIGTASPGKKLEVFGDIRANSAGANEIQLSTTSSSTSTAHVIGALSNSGFDFANLVISSNTTRFNISGSERMRIDSSGNVGIGTASPGAKLAVSTGDNKKQFVVNTTNDPVVQIGLPDWYNIGSLAFINGSGGERMRIDSSGNVGIGTASPSAKFTTNGAVQFGQSATATNNWHWTTEGGDGKLNLWNGNYGAGTLRMTVTSGGDVGIGTASPGARLEVSSSSNQAALFKTSATGSYGAVQIFNTNTNGEASIGFRDNSDSDATSWVIGKSVGATDAFGFFYGSTRMVIDTSGNVGIGGTAGAFAKVHVLGTLPTSSNASQGFRMTGEIPSGSTGSARSFLSFPSTAAASFTLSTLRHFEAFQGTFGASSIVTNQIGFFVDATLTGATNNFGFYSDIASGSNRWNFYAGGTAPNHFAGDVRVGKTNDADAGIGVRINSSGLLQATRDQADPLSVNRTTNDGTLVSLRQDGTEEGTISVSGNTVSYNAFAGSHWSQLQDGSKPDILRGTVIEAINELCVWPEENNERLPKSKVSDTASSKKVYGVFMAWDNDWTTTNDMYVTAVGAFICRVNGSVTVQEGDLLESNGDGTARVQADDIIRSSTIGKVTSTVKTHQYADGSYCVPTVLYCG